MKITTANRGVTTSNRGVIKIQCYEQFINIFIRLFNSIISFKIEFILIINNNPFNSSIYNTHPLK